MSIDKLNLKFVNYQGPVIDDILMEKITGKIDEVVDGVNNCDGGGGTGGSSGNEVVIGDESQITEDTKLFIDPEEVLPQGNDVVDSLEGNETDKAPSVRAVKEGLKDVYSTEEIVIGTYVDGKPIYKKTFIGTYNSKTILISNVDTLVNYYGQASLGGIKRTVPYYEYYQNKAFQATVNMTGNDVQTVFTVSGEDSSLSCKITIEYTKTTD